MARKSPDSIRAAAAANLLAELRSDPPTATFKVELVCIVDAIDRDMLVVRTPQRNLIRPNARAFHWAKRGFEALYLRRYR